MLVLWTVLTTALSFFLLYYVPGRLLLSLFREDPDSAETFPLSIGLGMVAVHTLSVLGVGLLGLFKPVYLTAGVVWAAGIVISASLLGWTLLRHPKPNLRRLLPRPSRTQGTLWAVSLLAFTFFSLHYEHDYLREDACNLRLTSTILGPVWDGDLLALNSMNEDLEWARREAGNLRPDTNDFLTGWEGQSLGPSMVLAPLLALFGSLGFRLAFALPGLLLPGLGYVLGRRVLGPRWAAWGVALLLTFSPYALQIRTFDENHLANVFGTLALVLLIRRAPSAVLAALAAGMFLAVRHVQVLALPFAFYYLFRKSERPWHTTFVFLATLIVVSLPEITKHVLFVVLHQGTLVEGMFARTPMPHSFLWWNFDFTLLLNYPFVDEPLRAPYHAFPTLFAFPLDIARRFGIILVAMVPLGILFTSRRDVPTAVLLAGWLFPLLALLMIQSNWVEENKMGIPVTSLAPLVIWVVGGLLLLVDGARKYSARAALGASSVAVVVLGVHAFQAVDAPPDTRVPEFAIDFDSSIVDRFVLFPDEHSGYVDWDRRRYSPRWLPSLTPEHEWMPEALARDARRLITNLEEPSIRQWVRPMFDYLLQLHHGFEKGLNLITVLSALESGEHRPGLSPLQFFVPSPGDMEDSEVVALSLESPPLLADEPLRVTDALPGNSIPSGLGPDVHSLGPFTTSWGGGNDTSILMARDRFGTVHILLAAGASLPTTPPPWLSLLSSTPTDPAAEEVLIRLPKHELIRLYELRCLVPLRVYTRLVVVTDEGVRLTEPTPFSPT